MEKELELYIHIPFCIRKCLYCDFVSFADKEDYIDEYTDILCEEVKHVSEEYRDRRISSIYIGGGTPSILNCTQIGKLMETLMKSFNIQNIHEKRKGFHLQKKIRPLTEVTMECNPGTVDKKKLKTFRKLGINRLSIGLQSADDKDLRTLGRIHNYEDFVKAFEAAREAGFDNINIDLMQAIPGQTLNAWKKVLAIAGTWNPEHISAYSLIIEDGTPFKQMQEKGLLALPDEDEEREIYYYTGEFLEKAGYRRYEISNYAKPGFECMHNTGYWRRADYLGIGLHASSMIENCRWKNTDDLDLYMKGNNIREEYSELSYKEQMEEFVFLGLRMTDGISKKDFIDVFHQDFDLVYGNIVNDLVSQGLIALRGDNVRLTDRGIDVSNTVLSQFIIL